MDGLLVVKAEDVLSEIKVLLPRNGFEIHPFKVGWYNERVLPQFALPHDQDTLAFVIVTTPAMFEDVFLPYVRRQRCLGKLDPIDECISDCLCRTTEGLKKYDIELIHDYEFNSFRRPKILVQTAGHVAGAAYYYQRSDVSGGPWDDQQKICGVSIHPVYGGWFALRGVMILKNLSCPDLPKIEPCDVVHENERRVELLEKFNFNWMDWSFRDIIPCSDRYSDLQKTYFRTKPSERSHILKSLVE